MNGGDAVLANHISVMVVLNVVMGEEDDDTFAVRGGSSLMAGKIPINCERIHTHVVSADLDSSKPGS